MLKAECDRDRFHKPVSSQPSTDPDPTKTQKLSQLIKHEITVTLPEVADIGSIEFT
ncbi:MAG: hypothetical protein N3E45_05740 [Oscillatoriaceae bacterium SKW80]|nr:hypothetical protein [Oscillatoriaceae bacterium SKYG93]MCX8120317.1 hypothetical protein [Oscillatoriaceae bacterium SKW80]MDW8453243.1 hypothetical protein [Oscillatoriaceae cyanobacterium SKYGB_i_bin93]